MKNDIKNWHSKAYKIIRLYHHNNGRVYKLYGKTKNGYYRAVSWQNRARFSIEVDLKNIGRALCLRVGEFESL